MNYYSAFQVLKQCFYSGASGERFRPIIFYQLL